VATIELPPLRERRDDIPLLIDIFLDQFGEKYQCPGKTIDKEAMAMLRNYSWPGNIRQLKNLIEKMVVLSDEQIIGIDEISSNLLTQQEVDAEQVNRIDTMSDLSLEAMEERYIRTAMKLSGGNQRKAADLLKISRDTLRYRLKKLKIR
jgi:DNA-binding NtrC family response regulator